MLTVRSSSPAAQTHDPLLRRHHSPVPRNLLHRRLRPPHRRRHCRRALQRLDQRRPPRRTPPDPRRPLLKHSGQPCPPRHERTIWRLRGRLRHRSPHRHPRRLHHRSSLPYRHGLHHPQRRRHRIRFHHRRRYPDPRENDRRTQFPLDGLTRKIPPPPGQERRGDNPSLRRQLRGLHEVVLDGEKKLVVRLYFPCESS